MVLIAGGSGLLGRLIVKEVASKNLMVRILTRNESNIQKLTAKNVEVTIGDLCRPDCLAKALEGSDTVISTANSFKGRGKSKIKTDRNGNNNLIDAAVKQGVKQFIFLSAFVPEGFKSIDFYRYQSETEEYLKNSGLNYTIIKHTFLMDVWGQLIGLPLIKRGVTTIIGKGNNPVNLVAALDVAKITAAVVGNPDANNKTLTIAGPENHSLNQVADIFEQVTGKKGTRRYTSIFIMKLMAFYMRILNPAVSRQMRTAIYMNSVKFILDKKNESHLIKMTKLRDWVKTNYLKK
jgi:uncharacterized protein YbjT (DUF2867 family)